MHTDKIPVQGMKDENDAEKVSGAAGFHRETSRDD
ncbi:hypothetical protein PMI08_03844 [Brevibacillus sp. CF112]|nr:hypothetical protein PMI08_03844 [Brevibacillus sp. CF112]